MTLFFEKVSSKRSLPYPNEGMMKRRGSGILLHITSVPSPFGIGDLGPGAYWFANFLSKTRQGFWQVLPLHPTIPLRQNSPYSSPSAFAGNPLLISPELMRAEGWLLRSEAKDIPSFPQGRVDYRAVTKYKRPLFLKAYDRFKGKRQGNWEFDHFCHANRDWLQDYSLFISLRRVLKGRSWQEWPPEVRDRKPKTVDELARKFRDRIGMEQFLQHLFFKQWGSLKTYCNQRGVQIIGDIPIYVSYDSADVWTHPEIFKLDEEKRPLALAGIPPDYFSATGQLWGNPIYRWDVLKRDGYAWWVRRIAHHLKWFDRVRLDHFKGFVDYWEVPAGERTAINGKWVDGPGEDFFQGLLDHFPCLPLIAEDLGVITPEVHGLRDRFGLPGMRVLQFAFGNDPLADAYKPINYIPNCFAYTGTHDNDTLTGWLYGGRGHSTRSSKEILEEKRNALRYLGKARTGRKEIHWELIRLLMMSAAGAVILPMQDLLGLGSEARMNRPATSKRNWEWRLLPGQVTPSVTKKLREMTRIYGRG